MYSKQFEPSKAFRGITAAKAGRGNIPQVRAAANLGQADRLIGQARSMPTHGGTGSGIAQPSGSQNLVSQNSDFTIRMAFDGAKGPQNDGQRLSVLGTPDQYAQKGYEAPHSKTGGRQSQANFDTIQPDLRRETAGNVSSAASLKGYSRTNLNYGFGAAQTRGFDRGSLITMSATKDGNINETSGEVSQDTIEGSADEIGQEMGEDMEEGRCGSPVAKFKPLASYFVLGMILLVRIMVQWHRKGLTYAYGYTGLGAAAGNPIFEISSAYPQLNGWYGLLAGLVYTIPYAGAGLVVGKMSEKFSRTTLLGIVTILASLTMGVSAAVNSFAVLAVMRFFHAIFNSATNPLSFSIISDYFPPERRSFANSIIQAGNYIGVGVSSLSILLISQHGWRAAYGIMAAAGVVLGLGTMGLIKEPERGRFLTAAEKAQEAEKKRVKEAEAALKSGNPVKNFVDSLGVVLALPCARNILIASSLRNFGGIIVSSFLPVFFGKNFPGYKAQYALLNAAAQMICGMTSSLAGGIMADKFEKKSYWAKALICMSGCALSLPLMALGTLQTSSFYLCVACYALKLLVAGTYSGPAITMIQNTAPLDQQANVISLYFCSISLTQCFAPPLFSYLANRMGCFANPALYGPLLTGFVAFGYIGSLPFWYKGGKAYKEFMEAKDEECLVPS